MTRSPPRIRGVRGYPAAVLLTVRRRRLFGPADRVLVALSAGPDSTALLAALAALREAGQIAALTALHVDHGLRPGAEDAACAAAACARLGVPLEVAKVRVGPGNLQSAARRARYAALRSVAARVGATRIATGHTRTDQAETVLLRLLRGAGARGLAGIPPRRGPFVRPLVDRSRAEGIRYLEGLGLTWREDPTNATPRFARNRVRHDLWPAVVALAPSAERAIARAADLARDDERALARRACEIAGTACAIPVAALAREPLAVRRRVVRRLWRNATGRMAGLEAQHVDAILSVARRREPGRVTLPGGRAASCRYGTLRLGEPMEVASHIRALEVPAPGRYAVPARGVAIEVSARRADALPWPLELRTRRPGDRFRPDGGRGSKKLKAWLIDRKIPREARDGILVLAHGASVLAVPELAAVAAGLGPSGVGLTVRVTSDR